MVNIDREDVINWIGLVGTILFSLAVSLMILTDHFGPGWLGKLLGGNSE